jgi:hypothetical protein
MLAAVGDNTYSSIKALCEKNSSSGVFIATDCMDGKKAP